jgi:hypothetical protein
MDLTLDAGAVVLPAQFRVHLYWYPFCSFLSLVNIFYE